jgi:ABC-type bacteriocin/lantibiotic exporter with double-glycine peptidase domain
VKLIKQEKNYTCGCACMRMVLDHFEMPVPTEVEMIEILDTDNVSGTRLDNLLLSAAQDFNLKTIHGVDSNIERVDGLHEKGWAVLLMVSVDVPHLVIYNGYNGNHIELLDPFFGQKYLLKSKFDSNRQHHPHYRWRAIKDEFKDLIGYDFEDLNHNKAFVAFKPK